MKNRTNYQLKGNLLESHINDKDKLIALSVQIPYLRPLHLFKPPQEYFLVLNNSKRIRIQGEGILELIDEEGLMLDNQKVSSFKVIKKIGIEEIAIEKDSGIFVNYCIEKGV